MAIIGALRTYMLTFSSLAAGAPLWVDYLGPKPTQYGILPLPGEKIVEQYINGGSKREFPFAFQSVESTSDDPERLANIGFYETFSDWLETQTAAGTLPTLGQKQTALSIEATGQGYLYQEGESDTGIYQIQCKLVYEQQP
jgi:hypothetical protein